MLEKLKEPKLLKTEKISIGRFEFSVCTIEGNKQRWEIPEHCIEDVNALIMTKKIMCDGE